MQFEELILKNFGKFKEKRIELSEGINLIYGENEAGKSTIHTFLRGMLYGMERGRGRAALTDRFSKYEPWDDPNYYAGTLRFRSGGRTFCLNRNFDKYSKSASLFCEDDGEELSLEQGDLDVLLGGLQESDYENTIGVGQNKIVVGKELAMEIKNFAANYCVTGDGELDLNEALENLRDRRKRLEKECLAREKLFQEKKDNIELEASYVWRDIYHLEQEIERIKEQQKEYQEEMERLRSQRREEKADNRFDKWRIHPIAILVMLVILVLTIAVFEKPWNLTIGVVVLLAEAIYTWNQFKSGKKKTKTDVVNEKEHFLWEKNVKSKWHLEKLGEDLEEKRIQYSNLKEQMEELEQADKETEQEKKQKKALELAENRMLEIAKELQDGITEKLNKFVSEIFCEITGGKYKKVWLDEQLQIFLLHENRKVDVNQISRGTLEQLHFSLRMAAVKILYEEEYPVILDDTFVYCDDVREEQILRWLNKQERQVLLFTCQKREEEILKKNNISYHKIELL